MAIVTVRIGRGHGTETKRKLVEALTATLSDTLDISRGEITVLIEEYARENWATGGAFSGEAAPASLPDLDSIFRKLPEKKEAPKPAKAPARKAAAKSRSRR
jgi:4-oxalocrotonate tautomerase